MRFAVLLFLALPAFSSELRFSIPSDPKTFDPLHISDGNSELIRYLTAGVLVRVNRVTDKVEPELAESFSLTPDGKAITFKLRRNLKFSDGTPLGAEDVLRTLNTALDPKQASPKGDTFRSDQGVPVGTIKRHATGKGNASKDEMIAAMRALGHAVTDDNEADALAILHWAINTQEVV